MSLLREAHDSGNVSYTQHELNPREDLVDKRDYDRIFKMMVDLTRSLDLHPEGHQEWCECKSCREYADMGL